MCTNYYSKYQHTNFNEESIKTSDLINMEAATLAEDIDIRIHDCREKSLALTKIEEAVMWANKAIAINQNKGVQ